MKIINVCLASIIMLIEMVGCYIWLYGFLFNFGSNYVAILL